MKKIFFILTTLMTIFGMTNVYADSCYNQYSPLISSSYTDLNGTVTLGVNRLYTALPNNQVITLPSNQTYFKGNMFYAIARTNDIISSNINWTETCNRYTSADIGGYTVTYADGSHATISPDSYGTLCDRWTSSGSMSYTQNYEPNITTIGLQYYTSGNEKIISCEVDSNGNFSCPIDSTYNTLSGFRFVFTMEKYNSVSIKYGLLSGNLNYCTSDTQQIINNNNQNTTNITNTITDDTINPSVTTDVNNISSSANQQGQNVVLNFLMIPFTFMTNVVNSFDNQCQSVCLGNCPTGGGGHDNAFYFVLPCINLQQILGNTVYGLIDALMCVTMIFAFIRSVIKFIQKCLLLEVDVSSEVRMFS